MEGNLTWNLIDGLMIFTSTIKLISVDINFPHPKYYQMLLFCQIKCNLEAILSNIFPVIIQCVLNGALWMYCFYTFAAE